MREPLHYNSYKMPFKEKIRYILTAAAMIFPAAYLFYRNVYICAILCLLALFYPSLKSKDIILKRQKMITAQFKDLLYSVSSSLSAGKSVESAFRAAAADLTILYAGEDALIISELKAVNMKVDMNEPLTEALSDFASRSCSEDIANFADMLTICKKAGGNLIEAIKNTASVIVCKIDLRNEIDVIIAEQRLNQKILSVMPFVLMAMIVLGSKEYVAPLYTPEGNIIMSAVLLICVAAHLTGKHIACINI